MLTIFHCLQRLWRQFSLLPGWSVRELITVCQLLVNDLEAIVFHLGAFGFLSRWLILVSVTVWRRFLSCQAELCANSFVQPPFVNDLRGAISPGNIGLILQYDGVGAAKPTSVTAKIVDCQLVSGIAWEPVCSITVCQWLGDDLLTWAGGVGCFSKDTLAKSTTKKPIE
jgi:hypothetical protein